MKDFEGNIIVNHFNHNGNKKIAYINHYFCKTLSEFMKKRERGLAFPLEYEMRPINSFHEHNFNEIEDTRAFDFYNGKLSFFI